MSHVKNICIISTKHISLQTTYLHVLKCVCMCFTLDLLTTKHAVCQLVGLDPTLSAAMLIIAVRFSRLLQ